MGYTIRMTQGARQALYRIPRGEVATVTAAISSLAKTPVPYGVTPSGLPNVYLLAVGGRIVAYEVIDTERVIVILWIAE